MIEKACGALLLPVIFQPLEKTNRSDQKQRGRKQIPGARQQICGVREWSGGGGKKSRACQIGSQGPNHQSSRGFLTPLSRGGPVARHPNGGLLKEGKERTG